MAINITDKNIIDTWNDLIKNYTIFAVGDPIIWD